MGSSTCCCLASREEGGACLGARGRSAAHRAVAVAAIAVHGVAIVARLALRDASIAADGQPAHAVADQAEARAPLPVAGNDRVQTVATALLAADLGRRTGASEDACAPRVHRAGIGWRRITHARLARTGEDVPYAIAAGPNLLATVERASVKRTTSDTGPR
jgi:hypothetical protein